MPDGGTNTCADVTVPHEEMDADEYRRRLTRSQAKRDRAITRREPTPIGHILPSVFREMLNEANWSDGKPAETTPGRT